MYDSDGMVIEKVVTDSLDAEFSYDVINPSRQTLKQIGSIFHAEINHLDINYRISLG